MLNETTDNNNNQQPKLKTSKYLGVKKLFTNPVNLNRSSVSVYSHGSKQSEVSYGSLNQKKKLSKSLVHGNYNDNGRRKQT